MKKCPVCGKEWSDATRFCGSCGAKLEDGNIVVPDIVPDDGKEEQRKKTEPVKPSVKKTIEPVRPKTRETAENKKIAEEKEEEKIHGDEIGDSDPFTGCSGSMYFLSGEDSEKGSGAGKYTETGYGAESGWRRCYG